MASLGAGDRVVMIHGLLIGNLATWYFNTARAVAKHRQVLLYDLRGHGRSERARQGYDLKTMATDLGALLDGWKCREPVTLVGHSYGALIALRYAMDCGDRVAGVVAVEPPMPPSDFAQMAEFVARSPQEMSESLPKPVADLLQGQGRRAIRFLEGLRFLVDDTSLLADLRAETEFGPRELERIRCPTLLVFGDRSECRLAGPWWADFLPHAQQVIVPGGHFLPTEAPSALTQVVEGFFRG